MPKTNNTRRVGPTEARAKLVNVRISPQKLNLVAQSIRGLPVQKALNELEFSRKRISDDVRKVLYSAVSNAENNHNLDIDSLVVAGPLPDTDTFAAVLDGGVHRQPLRRRVLARHHHVDVMAAAQAVVHH